MLVLLTFTFSIMFECNPSYLATVQYDYVYQCTVQSVVVSCVGHLEMVFLGTGGSIFTSGPSRLSGLELPIPALEIVADNSNGTGKYYHSSTT